jgi:hypothetical protein
MSEQNALLTFDEWWGGLAPTEDESNARLRGAFCACWNAAIAAEREACAEVARDMWNHDREAVNAKIHAVGIAAAIRARGEK